MTIYAHVSVYDGYETRCGEEVSTYKKVLIEAQKIFKYNGYTLVVHKPLDGSGGYVVTEIFSGMLVSSTPKSKSGQHKSILSAEKSAKQNIDNAIQKNLKVAQLISNAYKKIKSETKNFIELKKLGIC